MTQRILFPLMALLAMAPVALAQSLHGIPLKPDPPIAVDGELGDWSGVPNTLVLNQPAQVVFGKGSWTDADDMSGVVQLAWRAEYLFLAATVTDDVIAQAQRGAGIWQGDHVELYIDVQPDAAPEKEAFGDGQFQLALSPGNFGTTGDALADTSPEALFFKPSGHPVTGVLVASTKTANGWILEAAIPWTVLGVTPEANLPLAIEVGLSDTDNVEPKQESMLTSDTAVWAHERSRLRPMALAGADGVAVARATRFPLFDAVELALAETTERSFEAAPLPEGRQAVLRLMARIDTPKVAGYTQALRLEFNGQRLTGDRLLNKKLRQHSRGGQVYTMYASDRMSTYYSPDFEAPNHDGHYGLLDDVVPCLFEFDITDLLVEGTNTLKLENAADDRVTNSLHAGQAELVYQVPAAAAKAKAPAPTGPIPTITPRHDLRTAYTVEQLPDAKIALQFGDTSVVVESRFSTPAPAWVHGSNDYFRHSRRIEALAEGVVVYDTFTNRTEENLGIMHRHQANLGDQVKKLWIAGLEQTSRSGRASTPANCTTFAASDSWGLGFIASDDVFRVHSNNYGVDGSVGVADNNLVLPPGATYTAEWIIVPVEQPDYYRFINSARRMMGSNFLIDGGFAFLRAGPLTEAWSDDQMTRFLEYKNPKYICATIHASYKGRYSHGTAFQQVDHERYPVAFERWKGLYPEGESMVYFHCFLDTTDEGETLFHDARTLKADGSQANYGKETQRLYLPMTDNTYGAAIRKNVDIILDKLGADGVYWDEHQYSNVQYHYGEPWDKFSGDIDPTTMKIRGLKSSVTLLTEDWRVSLAKYIQSRGPLVGNGSPYTRAMAELNFPCFIETGSITNCTRGHLYSPIALGDHHTERSQQHAYETMLAALDYGSVYHWYNDMTVTPTHKTITSQMFPITPMEIHQGYIIGEERIVTKVSGVYGWGDASQHEVHVYNAQGEEVAEFDAPFVEQDGITTTELRLAEDWSAVIVKR